jgi:hypothetical protein
MGALEVGIAGLGGTSINETKPDGGDELSLGNMETVGVVVLESPELEEPHHASAREPTSDVSFSTR